MESFESKSAVDDLTFDEATLISALKKGLDDATVAMLEEWQTALDADLDAQEGSMRTHEAFIDVELRKARLYAAAGLSDLATGTLNDAWDYLTNAVDLEPTSKGKLQDRIQSIMKSTCVDY